MIDLTDDDLARLKVIADRIGEASYWAVDNEFADPYKPDVAIWDAEGAEVCIVRSRKRRFPLGSALCSETRDEIMHRARCIAEAQSFVECVAWNHEIVIHDVAKANEDG